jgi:hypothetical protein
MSRAPLSARSAIRRSCTSSRSQRRRCDDARPAPGTAHQRKPLATGCLSIAQGSRELEEDLTIQVADGLGLCARPFPRIIPANCRHGLSPNQRPICSGASSNRWAKIRHAAELSPPVRRLSQSLDFISPPHSGGRRQTATVRPSEAYIIITAIMRRCDAAAPPPPPKQRTRLRVDRHRRHGPDRALQRRSHSGGRSCDQPPPTARSSAALRHPATTGELL